MSTIAPIVCGVDFSEHSEVALARAGRMDEALQCTAHRSDSRRTAVGKCRGNDI